MTRAETVCTQAEWGLRGVGTRFSPDSSRIRNFLSKNHILYTFFDVKTAAAPMESLLKAFHLKESDLPVVGYGQDWLLKNPTNNELARRVGIKQTLIADVLFDLAIFPVIEGEGKIVKVIAGSLYGEKSPVKTYSDLFYADVFLERGAKLPVSAEYEERAIYVVEGEVKFTTESGVYAPDNCSS